LNIPDELVSVPVVSDLLGLCLAECVKGGLYAEFGVANGRGLRAIRKALPADDHLYGFDSFDGLPEAWNGFPAGAFRTAYRVRLANTTLVEGRFENTLGWFVRQHNEHVSFFHIDCDLYSSTKTVLEPRFVKGSVLLFNEMFGFPGYEDCEWRAWQESGLNGRWLGRWNTYQAAVMLDGGLSPR
jgi:hypothetical protein